MFLFTICCIALCFFQDTTVFSKQPVEVIADEAFYEDSVLNLSSSVSLNHPIGTIYSSKAAINSLNKQKKDLSFQPFSYISFAEEVKFLLHEGGKIACDTLDIDMIEQHAYLYAREHKNVIYERDYFSAYDRKNHKFQLKSANMDIHFADLYEKSNKKDSFETTAHLHASGKVSVKYDNQFTAYADKASYTFPTKNLQTKDANFEWNGKIILKPDPIQDKICRIIESGGGEIDAQQITIQPGEKDIDFIDAHGVIPHSIAQQEITFSCQRLHWDETSNSLFLKKDVIVIDPKIGKVTAMEQARIDRDKQKGEINFVETAGKTTLEYVDTIYQQKHLIISPNKTTIDHNHFLITLRGNGIEEPVVLEDYMGQIFADQACIYYVEREEKWVPNLIVLEGNVYMKNSHSSDPQDSKEVLQYACADYAEYQPSSQNIHLIAKEYPEVLFYDKIKNMQVGSKEFILSRNSETEDNQIRGVGKVRFSFNQEDQNRLKQRFNIE